MSWDKGFPNFAQGDSGVVMPGAATEAWNKIYQEKLSNKELPDFKKLTDVQAFITKIALNLAIKEETLDCDKISALEVARKTLFDFMSVTNQA